MILMKEKETNKTLVLTKKEKVRILSFVKEVIVIPSVESIYLLPIFYDGEFMIKVKVLLSNNPIYNNNLIGSSYYRYTDEEYKLFDKIAVKYNNKHSRLYFSKANYLTYNTNPYSFDACYRVELIGSTIIFDRFNEITKIQKECKENKGLIDWYLTQDDYFTTIKKPKELIKEIRKTDSSPDYFIM